MRGNIICTPLGSTYTILTGGEIPSGRRFGTQSLKTKCLNCLFYPICYLYHIFLFNYILP